MPARRKSFGTDTLIAIAATITSLCALVVAVYQTKLTREQQLNSVWPYVITYESTDEHQQSILVVANQGVGPAIVDSVRVVYKGKAYDSPTEVISEISKTLNRGPFGISWSHARLGRGSVISQGQEFTWIMVNDSSDNLLFRKALTETKSYIYYHSLYRERWHSIFHDGADKVVDD